MSALRASMGEVHMPARAGPRTLRAALHAHSRGPTAVRLILALTVLWFHSYMLGGFTGEPLAWLSNHQQNLGALAVYSFFFLSGLFVCDSYRRRPGAVAYLAARVLRIFPGLWACLIVTAAGFGPLDALIERGTLSGYWTAAPGGPLTYITQGSLLVLLQGPIDKLPAHVPFPGAFDGSLWTLVNEVTCYVLLAVAGVCGLLRRRVLPAALPVMFVLWLFPWAAAIPPLGALIDWLPHGAMILPQLLGFALGACAALWAEQIMISGGIAAVATLIWLATMPTPIGAALTLVCVPYLLLWAAYASPLRRWMDEADYSYGVYIYAFPVQQALAELDLQRYGLALFAALSVALTMPLAIVSWHLLEAPALRLKAGWRKAQDAEDANARRPTGRH